MFYNDILEPFIRYTEQNPDQTALRIDGQVYSYAQLVQRISPIMNELDAMSLKRAGIVMKNDLTAYAALIACLLNGVVAVPMPTNLSDEQRERIAKTLALPQILTVERMHYYYRMTFEDALSRIDNGLYHFEDKQIMSIIPHVCDNGGILCRPQFANDFKAGKTFSLTHILQPYTQDFPEICSIF